MDKINSIQKEIGVMEKTETNPFFKSKYFDINALLAQLKPLLEKYQLCIIQPLCEVGGKISLMTEVYDLEKKESVMKSFAPLPDLQDPQKMGSAITYYRRYALQTLFLLQTTDDDANLASTPKTPANRSIEASKAMPKEDSNISNDDLPF
jgi:hypothetical protein